MSSLNPVFTIGTQISEAVRLHFGVDKKEAIERSIEALRLVGIAFPERRIKQYPHEMSGGMRQRVMIAMALACEPKLLIADEPTTALDVMTQAQILELIRRLADDLGLAMLIISHDLTVLGELCDRAAVMYAGRIVERGPATAVLSESAAHPYTRQLLDCFPRPEDGHASISGIPGSPPDLAHPPRGCRFHDRCAVVEEQCFTVDPAEVHVPGMQGHLAACHRVSPALEVTP
jgi:peptide/nickel transport system ATP-binding protein